MKKKVLLAAAALALILYFRPLPFPELSYDADGTLCVKKVDLSLIAGDLDMDSTMYVFSDGSPEAEAIEEVLERYSYRRSLRTPFPGTDLVGNAAGFWLHMWGGDFYFSSGGTGEINLNDHVYRMGWSGNQKNIALMAEISALLMEAEPYSGS